MIRSMTAFAGAERTHGHQLILCELRSVNHRYCDVQIKMPESFRFAETQIRTAITERIKRGKIECSLTYKAQLQRPNYTIDRQAVASLLEATDEIATIMATAQPFSALEVLAFPGIQQELQWDREILSREIDNVLQQALNGLLDTREREGHILGQFIEERIEHILTMIHAAEQRIPQVLAKWREKLVNRVAELSAAADNDRLEQELLILTQKLDNAEELHRLSTHAREVLLVLQREEPIGRRLDFLMQEMHREANTLGAKSMDTETTHLVIDLKVLIEQMREQIQNIE